MDDDQPWLEYVSVYVLIVVIFCASVFFYVGLPAAVPIVTAKLLQRLNVIEIRPFKIN
jgi:hypothetical protein